jgi:hypothetical protein
MDRVNLKLLIPSLLLTFVGVSLLYTLDINYFRAQLIFLGIYLKDGMGEKKHINMKYATIKENVSI